MTAGREVSHVSAHFDPLLAEHARRLRKEATAGRVLVAEVTNPEHPLLPQRARAELVAALADVDYVVLADGGPVDASDSDATQWLVERVRGRSNGGPSS